MAWSLTWFCSSIRRNPGSDHPLGVAVRPGEEQDGFLHHHVRVLPGGGHGRPRVHAGDGRVPVHVCVAHQRRVRPHVSQRSSSRPAGLFTSLQFLLVSMLLWPGSLSSLSWECPANISGRFALASGCGGVHLCTCVLLLHVHICFTCVNFLEKTLVFWHLK